MDSGGLILFYYKNAPAIVYPTDYMSLIENKVQLDIIKRFVDDLGASLGVACQRISFNELWDLTAPEESKGMSLPQYMEDVRLLLNTTLCVSSCCLQG